MHAVLPSSSLPPPYSPFTTQPAQDMDDISVSNLIILRSLATNQPPPRSQLPPDSLFRRAVLDHERNADPSRWGLYRHGQLITSPSFKQDGSWTAWFKWITEPIILPSYGSFEGANQWTLTFHS
ncbi:uncharacterized protein L203_102566 [Cryptococcus depauperatus CBS 7841]|uniref:Uncharacterized protein n=1 Tax=Cryptococcus depauperatus CBS 7841 TaxID=1295531 RepID=A0A1E3IDK9_9TREE|nr:hypothetical protein L203_03928 [Cryptococcus depauperatus CBS 7841]